jgi:hypothetical protein
MVVPNIMGLIGSTPQFTSCVYAITKIEVMSMPFSILNTHSMPFLAIQHHILPTYPIFIPYTTVCTYILSDNERNRTSPRPLVRSM